MFRKNNFVKIIGFLLIAALFFAILPSGGATAQTTITVCDSGCDYTSIQAAIDAAASGDIIEVAAGTYNENISIPKSLTLQGAGRDLVTIEGISPTTDSGVLEIKADNVTIDGFTIQGVGNKTVRVTSATANLVFTNNIVVTAENTTDAGGWSAFETNYGQAQDDHFIDSNIFVANTTSTLVYYNPSQTNLVFTNNTFTGTMGTTSGLVFAVDGANGTQDISGNTFDLTAPYALVEMFGTYDLDQILADNIWPEGAVIHAGKIVTPPPVHNITQDTYFYAIQPAIDAAIAGDTIMVEGGTVFEYLSDDTDPAAPITIDKEDLTLTTDPANPATLRDNGASYYPVIEVFADGVIVENFNLERNNATSGGQVVASRKSDVIIRDNVLTGTGNASPAITIDHGLPGAYSDDVSNVQLLRNQISGEFAWGFGIRSENGPGTLTDLLFEGNNVDVTGSGAFIFTVGTNNGLAGANITFLNNTFAKHSTQLYDNTGSSDIFAFINNNEIDGAVILTDGVNVIEQSGVRRVRGSIQSAIDAASVGDFVLVGPSNYAEDVVVDKDVTLEGMYAPDSDDAAVIDGWVDVTADGATVSNMKIVPGNVSGNAAGIRVGAGNTTITGNLIEGMTGDGTGWGSIKGIHLYYGSASTYISNIDIVGNIIKDLTNPFDNTNYGGADGIMVQGFVDTVNISQNMIQNVHSDGWAYGLEVTPTGNDPSLSPLNIMINNNFVDEITATTYPGVGLSIDAHTAGDSTVTPADASEVTVRENAFTNIAMPILNKDNSKTLDASANWFEVLTPTEVADSVTGEVDYTPWLISGTDTSTDPGFQGDFSTLWVDDDSPQTGMDGRIQEGVNLVTESTVYVADGTYVEEILIDKPVHIIGQGPGTIIESPDSITQLFGSSSHPIVLIQDTEDVTIENLVIDGAGKGNANYKFVGVAFSNAGGLLQDLTLTGIIDTPFSGAQHGVAVSAYNTDGVTRSISLQDNTFIEFQKNAIALNANESTRLLVDVQGNTITGAGATSTTAQNGIQVWAAQADGTIANNTVSGIGYSGSGWVGSSILIYQNNFGDLLIDNNTITEAQMGVYVYDGGAMISNNTIEVEKIGDFSYGIIASDPPTAMPQPYGEESLEISIDSIETRAILPVAIEDNTITLTVAENGVLNDVGTEAWGILAEGGWTLFDLDLKITGNIITGFDYGVEVFQTDESTGEIVSVEAHQNCIIDSQVYAMVSNADAITVNAINNFWGDPTGPFHPTLNPDGTGGEVSDYIDFEPWLDVCPLIEQPEVPFEYFFPLVTN